MHSHSRRRLYNNSLSSSLPASWASATAFPALQILALQKNNLSGTLPAALGEADVMPRLQELYLQNNRLVGGLPAGWNGAEAFPNLRFLYLSGNPLGGAPPGRTVRAAAGWAGWLGLAVDGGCLLKTAACCAPIACRDAARAVGEQQLLRLPPRTVSLPTGQVTASALLLHAGLRGLIASALTLSLFPRCRGLNGTQLTGILPPEWGLGDGLSSIDTMWVHLLRLPPAAACPCSA